MNTPYFINADRFFAVTLIGGRDKRAPLLWHKAVMLASETTPPDLSVSIPRLAIAIGCTLSQAAKAVELLVSEGYIDWVDGDLRLADDTLGRDGEGEVVFSMSQPSHDGFVTDLPALRK